MPFSVYIRVIQAWGNPCDVLISNIFSDKVLNLKDKTDAYQIFEVFSEQEMCLIKQTMK